VRTRTRRDRTLTRLHFLDGTELSATQLTSLLDRALALKQAPAASRALEGKTVALLFEHPSTRTRVSFEAGVFGLGGAVERARRARHGPGREHALAAPSPVPGAGRPDDDA
jgi:ornithine carbamoyltransferase